MSRSLSNSVAEVLQQGLLLCDLLNDETYTRPLQGTFSGSLGAHYRHVLDHFLCLLEGIRTGEVNYDRRRRDASLEKSVVPARQLTKRLVDEFNSRSTEDLERECVVVYSVGYGEREAEATASTIAREIVFCVGHAIHHYAILKLLCAGSGIELPCEFGIAPSTLKHLKATANA